MARFGGGASGSGRGRWGTSSAAARVKSCHGRSLAAVDEIAGISTRLLRSLEANAPPKNREEEAAKAKARAAERCGVGVCQITADSEVMHGRSIQS